MRCNKCSKEISYPITDKHIEFISLFIDKDEIVKFITTDDLFENGNCLLFAQRIFNKSLNSQGMGKKIDEFYGDKLYFNTICPLCGKETQDYFWNYNKNSIYNHLVKIEKEYIYRKVSGLIDFPRDELEEIFEHENGDAYYVYIAQKTIEKINIDEANKIQEISGIIEKFHYVGKGGEGEFLAYILGLVSASIIPNIIYDLLKYGGKRIILWLKIIKDKKQVERNVDKKVAELYPDYYEKYINDSILKYLSKKQRKKIIMKIIADRVDEKTKIIIKANNNRKKMK
jgi:hypothetical protein